MLDSGITMSPEGPQFGQHVFDMSTALGSSESSEQGRPVQVQTTYEESQVLMP